MQVFNKAIDEQRTFIVTERDSIACEAGLDRQLVLNQSTESIEQTSSSTSVMRDWRYSSRVKWNSSRSLRLTGTVMR